MVRVHVRMDLRFFLNTGYYRSYRAKQTKSTNTIVHESFIDRHVAGAWPRARFVHKFTKALRHEVAVGTVAL